MKTWVITGISRGLGLALARVALQRGDRVIGTARSPVPLDSERLSVLTLDLADPASSAALIERAFAGRVDVLVNNAGFGVLGAAEHATEAETQDLFAVNVFAPMRLIRAALPHFRAQGAGHIVNITSIAARAPGTGSALYAATKYALEGYSVALAQEVSPFGIKVTAVAPGQFRTEFLSGPSLRISEGKGDYAAVGASLKVLESRKNSQQGDPNRAALAILQAVDADHPPLHLLLGSDAWERERAKHAAVEAEMRDWEAVTRSTDFAAD